jgi:hypothetical protein
MAFAGSCGLVAMKGDAMTKQYVNSAEWDHATGVARQVCARVFRDGGAPADALDTFGLAHSDIQSDWRSAVDSIAHALCRQSEGTQPSVFKHAA